VRAAARPAPALVSHADWARPPTPALFAPAHDRRIRRHVHHITLPEKRAQSFGLIGAAFVFSIPAR
jgi:hypothetical protein